MIGGDKSVGFHVQIVKIANQQGKYQITVFDGVETFKGILASQMSHFINNGEVKELTVITVNDYSVQSLATTGTVIVFLDIDKHADLSEDLSTAVVQPNNNNYNQNISSVYGNQGVPQNNNYSNPYGNNNNNNPAPAYNDPYGNNNQYNNNNNNPYNNNNNVGSVYGGQTTTNNNYNNNSKPVIRDDNNNDNLSIIPISALNPYSQKWTIKARVTAKSDMRTWNNAKGSGNLFSVDLLDSSNGEIRGTFFKQDADKFFPILQESKVYTFTGGTLKLIQNKQYSTLKNNYEITFSTSSVILPVAETSDIKVQSYNFVKIDQIANIEPNTTIDVLAVIKSVGELQEINSTKLSKVLQKRDLVLMDDSLCEIKLTLWGDKAVNIDPAGVLNSIMAYKGVKVGDFGGRSLGTVTSTAQQPYPQIPEGVRLHEWKSGFSGGVLPTAANLSSGGSGGGAAPESFDRRKTISAIKDEGLGMGEKRDYLTVRATVNYIKHDSDPWYTACITQTCNNKKVVAGMNGQFRCEKCNQTLDECNYRYVISSQFFDFSGNGWFTLFSDSGEKLLGGRNAKELHEMRTEGNELVYEQVFSEALFKTYICNVSVKNEIVNDESRVKSQILSLTPVDFVTESKNMISAIAKY